MKTIIQYTGSGSSETQIDYLYDLLEQYTLDPVFDPFIAKLNDIDADNSWITGSRPIEFQDFTHMFIGNFPELSVAYGIYTADTTIIATLTVLISINTSQQNYKDAVAKQ